MKSLVLLAMLFLLPLARAEAGGAADPTPALYSQQVLVLFELPPPHFRADGNYAPGYADAAGNVARRRLATSIARSNGLRLVDDWPLPLLRVDCYVMDIPPSESPEEVAAKLARDPRVAWAQPMHVFRSLGHDDPLFGVQPAAAEWRLNDMHSSATGRDVRVAIVDSGVQLDHPDLAGQVVAACQLRRRSRRACRGARNGRCWHRRRAREQPSRHRRDRTRSAPAGVACLPRSLGQRNDVLDTRARPCLACRDRSQRASDQSEPRRAVRSIDRAIGQSGNHPRDTRGGSRRPRSLCGRLSCQRAGSRGSRRRECRNDASRHDRGARHRRALQPAGIALGIGLRSVLRGGTCKRDARSHDRRAGKDAWPALFFAVEDRRPIRRTDRLLRESQPRRCSVRVRLRAFLGGRRHDQALTWRCSAA